MGIFFDGAYEVLKVMQKPMHYVELTQLAIDRGLIESDGKTPDQTMNKELHKAAKESFYESKIIFLGDGIFALSDPLCPPPRCLCLFNFYPLRPPP